MYESSIAVIINDHKFSDIKQQLFIISQFCRSQSTGTVWISIFSALGFIRVKSMCLLGHSFSLRFWDIFTSLLIQTVGKMQSYVAVGLWSTFLCGCWPGVIFSFHRLPVFFR